MKRSFLLPALAGLCLPLTAQEESVPAAAPAEQPQAEQPAETPAAEPAPAEAASANDVRAAYRGIVKVEVAVRTPDFAIPWNSGEYGRGNGTGFMVAPGLFLTNAHVVSNAERILIAPYGDARKIPATVKFVAHDADLALLEVADKAAFADVPCLRIGEGLPELEDTVRAVGYPMGGNRLSVTRGIVSRIDNVPYSHTMNGEHLAVQIDAAINPGNSGGPVLKGDEVVGVAFQGLRNANATGYMIPVPVIRHFLKDIEDGHYDGYVELGASFAETVNPAMRRHYGLSDDGVGCVVSDVAKGTSCDGKLQPGDVVLAVQGHPVDSAAMIELDGVRVSLVELAERAFNGDVLHFDIRRNGEPMSVDVTLSPMKAAEISSLIYDKQPRYVMFGGLLFQPLGVDVVKAHSLSRPDYAEELFDYVHNGGAAEKEDIVVLTDVLRDEVNARFEDLGRGVVTKVNGVPVTGLSQMASLLYPEGGELPEFIVIELAGAERPLVFDREAVQAANARIKASSGAPEMRLNP